MTTIPTLNCVYPDLVLKLLTSWHTVRFFQFLVMTLTDLCAIYHQPQELTPKPLAKVRDQNRGKHYFNEIIY